MNKDSLVVETGAGRGLCRFVKDISDRAGRLMGVDPSPNIEANPYVHSYIKAPFEDADIPDSSADIIYSIYVMEHIRDPDRFFAKAYKTLKEDGKLYFITPNRPHYFVFFSRLADKMNIKNIWVEKIMGGTVNLDYGFKSYYLINDEDSIRSLAKRYGFKECSIIYMDSPEAIAKYFPRGAKWIPFAISLLMKFFRVPDRYHSDIIAVINK